MREFFWQYDYKLKITINKFSCSVTSNSLQPHGLQHARLPCPSPIPRACSNLSIEPMMPFNHLVLCPPLLLLPSIFPSIRVFSLEPVLHIKWPKCWSFSISISPSNEYSRLISFKTDWFDLLAVQGTLKSLFQITVQNHQFISTQLSYNLTLTSIHDYWKNHSFD